MYQETFNYIVQQDETYRKLSIDEKRLQKEIHKRKRKVAQERKILFNTINELVLDAGIRMETIEKEKISRDSFRNQEPLGQKYITRQHNHIEEIGYDCRGCGVVKGTPIIIETQRTEQGREENYRLTRYKCMICDDELAAEMHHRLEK